MVWSILIDYKILRDGLNPSINTPFARVSKEAIDLAGKLFESYGDCEILATKQAKERVSESLSIEQKIRLEATIKSENTTSGVASFTAENSTSESAKNLSYS